MAFAYTTFPADTEAEPHLRLAEEIQQYDPWITAEVGAITLDLAEVQRIGLDPCTIDPKTPPADTTFEEYIFSRDSPLGTEGFLSTPLSVTIETMANFTLRTAVSAQATALWSESIRLSTDPKLNGQRATLQLAHSLNARRFLNDYYLELNHAERLRLQTIVEASGQQR